MNSKRTLTAALLLAGLVASTPAVARTQAAPEPLYPVSPWIVDDRSDAVYPSAAGDFLVYSRRSGVDRFDVVRISRGSTAGGKTVPHFSIEEAVREGVAVASGAIGYVTNRIGPVSAWMWQAHGDGHLAIANMAVYRGVLAPMHLNAARDGSVWCFDSTLEKSRYNQLLNEFATPVHDELLGQQWRIYDSDSYRHKMGYAATKTGKANKFQPPVLFTFDTRSSRLTMIPNAFDGAISPDGRRVAFVRETNGNYDIWVQDVEGSALEQLTSSPFGDFEPAWSPDGRKLAFVSNRDAKGDVRATSIYVLDVASGEVTRVTNGVNVTDGGPTWLDATTIAFHSNRDPKAPQSRAGRSWNIWTVRIDGR